MATSWRWIAGAVLVAVAAVVGIVAMSEHASPPSHRARWSVVDLGENGGPLHGEPIDLVAVGDRLVGLVRTKSGDRFVTSRDGLRWTTVQPVGLPTDFVNTATYPGGLGAVDHVLFSDGASVFVRVVTGSTFSRLGSVALYSSDADARTWRRVALPTPAGKGAFPISATMANGRRYIVGSVFEPAYSRKYLDAAVWVASGDGAFRRIDAPDFSGPANQTIFALDVVDDDAIVAGGGDGSLRDNTQCCNFDFGAAFWRSADNGEHWSRATALGRRYNALESATAVGFVQDGAVIHADMTGTPARTAESNDQGVTWTEAIPPRTKGGRFPRASRILHIDGGFVATTTHGESCTDCTEGAVAISEDREHWRDVTPPFPCGTEVRTEYGFISRPVVVGSSIAVLAACGEPFSGFNETLLGVSNDRGSHWHITRYKGRTGNPGSAVAGHERIVTLTGVNGNGRQRLAGPVRAVVVHP